jgi:hypothetical protein
LTFVILGNTDALSSPYRLGGGDLVCRIDTIRGLVHRIDARTGVITTVVGNGQPPTMESSRPTAT